MKTTREIVIEELGSAIYKLPVDVQKYLFDRTRKLTNKIISNLEDALHLKMGTIKLYESELSKNGLVIGKS